MKRSPRLQELGSVPTSRVLHTLETAWQCTSFPEELFTSCWLRGHSDITPVDLYVPLAVRWGGDNHLTGDDES